MSALALPRPLIPLLLLLGLLVSPGLGPAPDAIAQETEDSARDCFWNTADDPNAINVAYPDEGADYWGGGFSLTPGTEIRLRGQFPYARYMSFNVYSPQLAPIDAIADVQIVPDEGSSNPFDVGADRTVEDRSYMVRIIGAAPPEDPADREPNTLYVSLADQPSPEFIILYRVYVQDEGRDSTGDVGLPEMTVVGPDGSELDQPASCTALNVTAPPTINELQANGDLGDTPAPAGSANDVLKWRRFFNLPRSQAESNTATTPFSPIRGVVPASDNGGYLSNIHNTYGAVLADRSLGSVLVLEGRAPTVPLTRDGQPVMGDGDLRYWSLCENERNSTRFLGCISDETAVLGPGGSLTVVVSTPEDRPANATAECGVNWLPWGAQPEALLILRHMLPNPDFVQTVFNVDTPYEIDAVVGEYLPRGNHLGGPEEFEARGCPAGFTQTAFDLDAQTVERIDAPDPAALSVAVSQARFGQHAAGAAVLATTNDFADALAGAPLTLESPLLLTDGAALDPTVAAELERALDADATVYLLGGEAALSSAVADAVADLGFTVQRLGGATRLQTAAAIAAEVKTRYPDDESDVVVVARAFGSTDDPTAAWADAVAVGGFAAAYHAPVVLTSSDALDEAAATALEELAPTETIVMGGPEALSDAVLDAVPNGRRVAGADRFQTAGALVAEWKVARDRFVLTDGSAGDGWVAGLLAAGLSADAGAPQLLTAASSLSITPVDGYCDADLLVVGAAPQPGPAAGRC